MYTACRMADRRSTMAYSGGTNRRGAVKDTDGRSAELMTVVATAEEFDHQMAGALPDLLDRAASHTRRFLKETGQWVDDVEHEKLALRWGYELVERFLVYGRMEVPCRPLLLLDSLIAKYLSQPEPFCYHKDLCSPLGRFVDGLTARAVISRDALMALFHHLYGWGQGQIVRLLGFDPVEAQRVYKNFDRWRRAGWQRAITEMGVTEAELQQFEGDKVRDREAFNREAERLIRLAQAHYRKSEPDHYRCLNPAQWTELFQQNYGHDYRVWHLALCRDCLAEVWTFRRPSPSEAAPLHIDLQMRPLQRAGLTLVLTQRGGRKHGATGQPAQHISTVSH